MNPLLVAPYDTWAGATASVNLGVQENSPGSNNWVLSGSKTASGRVIVANDPHRNVGNPSLRYIVHLNAPDWTVIGATEPMLPGVSIGHNGRVGWGLTILGTDQSDVYVETVNPANPNEVRFNGAWALPDGAPTLMAQVAAARWRVRLSVPVGDALLAEFRSLLQRDRVEVEKIGKNGPTVQNIRPGLLAIERVEGDLDMLLAAGSALNIRPELVVRASA